MMHSVYSSRECLCTGFLLCLLRMHATLCHIVRCDASRGCCFMLLSLNSSKTCFITFTYQVLYFPPSQLCIIHVTSEGSLFCHCVFLYLQNVCMWQHFCYDLCVSLRWDSSAVHKLSLDSICLLSTRHLYSFLHEIGWGLFFLGGFICGALSIIAVYWR